MQIATAQRGIPLPAHHHPTERRQRSRRSSVRGLAYERRRRRRSANLAVKALFGLLLAGSTLGAAHLAHLAFFP